MMIPENCKIVDAFKPQASNAAPAGDWVSLKNYAKILIICQKSGGNASANTFTVNKATEVAGSTHSDGITLSNWWLCDDTSTTDALVKQAAGASFATGSGATPAIVAIEIDASELGDYDCVQVKCAAGNSSNIVSAIYVLSGARYAQRTPPTAITD